MCLQGARANMTTCSHQLRLNTIEALAHEYLITGAPRRGCWTPILCGARTRFYSKLPTCFAAAAVALPPSIRSRLLLARRVASSLNERLKVLDVLEPTR